MIPRKHGARSDNLLLVRGTGLIGFINDRPPTPSRGARPVRAIRRVGSAIWSCQRSLPGGQRFRG